MSDLLIVGAGLTGLFAAALASRRGASVTLICEGRGALEVSHGCIDVLGATSIRQGFRRLRKSHPYALVGRETLEASLNALREIALENGIPYQGDLASMLRLPTALGALHPTCLCPSSMVAGDIAGAGRYTIAGLQGFRDFHADFVTSQLQQTGIPAGPALALPLVDAPRHRDAYATDLARLLDDAPRRDQLIRAWRPRMKGVQRLGVPAVIGLDRPAEAFKAFEDGLGVGLFEIPTLPPSVPGLRLERLLRKASLAAGANLVEGAHAIGRVDGRSGGRRVSGVVAQTAGGARLFAADAVMLATGGILNGGLVTRLDGRVQESVFDLPVSCSNQRAEWTGQTPFEAQPYASFGIRVGADMRPRGQDAEPLFQNLYAAGGLLAGADRTWEGSRQGIDLATAYRAVEVALG